MDGVEEPLLNILKKEQERHGYLSDHILKQVSIEQDIPLSKLYGITEFYTMLRNKPVGENVIEICMSTSCFLNDSGSLKSYLEEKLGIKTGETTVNGEFSLFRVSCIGCCSEAPAMIVNDKPYTKLTKDRIDFILEELRN